ncbi:MAG TPA: SPW repeat protein [Corynebacteriales bacterium]|nr:SPW repeat protein [Mycobacteriales bacterium]
MPTAKPAMDPDSLQPQFRPFRQWQDWVNLLLGIYLAVASTWTPGAAQAWWIAIGVIMALLALAALVTASSKYAEYGLAAMGVILMLSPWLGNYAVWGPAVWTAWIIGAVVAVLALGNYIRKTQYFLPGE